MKITVKSERQQAECFQSVSSAIKESVFDVFVKLCLLIELANEVFFISGTVATLAVILSSLCFKVMLRSVGTEICIPNWRWNGDGTASANTVEATVKAQLLQLVR